jgi:hypothetical protein
MNIFTEPVFKAEHERYWEMREAGRGDEIDPMWTACYCMVSHALLLTAGVDQSCSLLFPARSLLWE